jgi:hypothetical protein
MRRLLRIAVCLCVLSLALNVLGGCATVKKELSRPLRQARIVFTNCEDVDETTQGKITRSLQAWNPHIRWNHGPCLMSDIPTPAARSWWSAKDSPKGWSRRGDRRATNERGVVHIAVLRSDTDYSKDSKAYVELLKDLSLAKPPWKIVMMPRSLCLPNINEASLELAQMMTREGVALVISVDGDRYTRSKPLGSAPNRVVRYIQIGAGVASRDENGASGFAQSFALEEPCYILIQADEKRLVFEVFDAEGKMRDTVTLAKGETPVRFYSLYEIRSMEQTARRKRQEEQKKNPKKPSESQ